MKKSIPGAIFLKSLGLTNKKIQYSIKNKKQVEGLSLNQYPVIEQNLKKINEILNEQRFNLESLYKI